MAEPSVSRLLNRSGLRSYLGMIPWEQCKQRMHRGRLPRPVWGLEPDDKDARWDKRAVDRALDAESAIPSTIEAQEQALDRALGLS